MPRAIWTGAISFGLVNVPVRMYSAIDTTDLEFGLQQKVTETVGAVPAWAVTGILALVAALWAVRAYAVSRPSSRR